MVQFILTLDDPYTAHSSKESCKKRSISLSDISETVERAVEKAIERTLPSFLAGYMACAAGFNPEGYAYRQIAADTTAIEENDEDAADDIDFDFLGLN